jgi:TolA-binding protein
VKGKQEPVRVFELRHRGAPAAEELPLLAGYARALGLYRAQRFAEARVEFDSLLMRFPGDGPAALMLGRCDRLVSTPKAGRWDGVFSMEHK